jgi:ABC-type dipeptide/oligopeptide/nickel transport system ATPase component
MSQDLEKVSKPKKTRGKKDNIQQPQPPAPNHEIINFYELDEVKKYAVDHVNPNYNFDRMPLKHPMRMVICGASGSGKSNLLLNIINSMNNTFEKILIFTQDKDEQLYNYLADAIPEEEIEIFEGIDYVINYNFDNLDEKQHLIIFDDMCIEKESKQKNICDLYVRGRKMAKKCGCSVIYLTQSYFQVPPVIRKQMTSLILRKINGKRDARAILSECAIDATTNQLMNLYEACCDPNDITSFLFIDFNAPEDKRFRYKFDTILNIQNF